MIAIGVIIMVLGFLGCCGAIRENRCMLLLVGIITLFFLRDLIRYSLNQLMNISWKRKNRRQLMKWSETQPIYYFSLASVLHQPPHHLHPPAGGGNPGSCGGEEGKTGSDAIVRHLSSHQLVQEGSLWICCVQVKDWMKERLQKFTPLSSQPANVREDLEKLQTEVTHTHTHTHTLLSSELWLVSSQRHRILPFSLKTAFCWMSQQVAAEPWLVVVAPTEYQTRGRVYTWAFYVWLNM